VPTVHADDKSRDAAVGSVPSQIGNRAGGVVGLTRPCGRYATHHVDVVALHMNAGCVTEPLAKCTGETGVIAVPASVSIVLRGWPDFVDPRRLICAQLDPGPLIE
jgi:hypothetical protein